MWRKVARWNALPPDCWTAADNKKILIVNSQGAVTSGAREEEGGTQA